MKRIFNLLIFSLLVFFLPLNLRSNDDSEGMGGTVELQNEIVDLIGSIDIDLNQAHNGHINIAEFRVINNHPSGFEIRFTLANEGWLVHTVDENVARIRLKNIRLRKGTGTLGSGLTMGPKTFLSGSEWGYSYTTSGEAISGTNSIYRIQAKIPNTSSVQRVAGTYREYLTIHLIAGDSEN